MLDESDVQENNWTLRSCKIEWRIQNFCLAVRTEKNTVLSPEFTLRGRNNYTKWRMNLVVNGVEDKKGVISFALERLPDHGPNIISLNWEVALKVGTKSYEPVEEGFSFKVNSVKDINLKSVAEVLEHLLPFEDDVVVVECFVLVNNKEEPTNPSVSPPSGLKYLSEDLQRLKSENVNSLADVTIKVGDREIKAHKAILCRNKVFDSHLENGQKNVIELSNLDYEAVDKFVTFLYSGNIDDVLVNPSISMIRCVAHFNNEILKCYYIPEELNLSTTINTETHEFHWTVSDFPTDRNSSVTSPPIRRLNVDTTWRLTISVQPKRIREYNDCISLYADIFEGERPSYFCLEFGVQNEAGQVFHPKRIIRVNKCYDNLGFRNFVKQSDLIKSHIYMYDTIRVVFKIRTSNGSQDSSIGCRNLSYVSSTVKSFYEELSLDLMNLLKTKKYCDIIMKFNNKSHYAHRCVLASRSIEFSRIISRMPPKNHVVTLENIEDDNLDDTLEPILEYLYSGILDLDDVNKVTAIYDSALVLGIQSLIEECQRVLNPAGHNV